MRLFKTKIGFLFLSGRIENYKQKHGEDNREKLNASEEVLALSDSQEDLDVDVGGGADETEDDTKKEL